MTTHTSVRLAWHNDGWNGHICREPAANTYCVGPNSYPGQYIAEKRDLKWEIACAGESGSRLDRIPPCCYSYNAFGYEEVFAKSPPPAWFNDDTQIRKWSMPPATVCVWPYEEMYGGEVKYQGRYIYERRLENARKYFKEIEPDRSLIFYYANYSNPFSEDEAKRYALIGLSRVKALGEELYYEGGSREVKERYAGGFIWQRAITSHYPDQGLRLPYHVYQDNPEVLQRIALFPENPRLCNYATRPLTDDALGLVEGFHRVVLDLLELGDTTEDWARRARWLETLIAELWQHRGLLPGMPAVLEVLSFESAIPFFKQRALEGQEIQTRDLFLPSSKRKLRQYQGLSWRRTTSKLFNGNGS